MTLINGTPVSGTTTSRVLVNKNLTTYICYNALFKLLYQMLTYNSGIGSYSIKFTMKHGDDGPIDPIVKDSKHCESASI